MYTRAITVIHVKTVYGSSNCFDMKVGMHQGSALSPLLFVIVMEALSREFRVALPWVLIMRLRGRLYSSCVQSSMLHGSETWPV